VLCTRTNLLYFVCIQHSPFPVLNPTQAGFHLDPGQYLDLIESHAHSDQKGNRALVIPILLTMKKEDHRLLLEDRLFYRNCIPGVQQVNSLLVGILFAYGSYVSSTRKLSVGGGKRSCSDINAYRNT